MYIQFLKKMQNQFSKNIEKSNLQKLCKIHSAQNLSSLQRNWETLGKMTFNEMNMKRDELHFEECLIDKFQIPVQFFAHLHTYFPWNFTCVQLSHSKETFSAYQELFLNSPFAILNVKHFSLLFFNVHYTGKIAKLSSFSCQRKKCILYFSLFLKNKIKKIRIP